MRQLTEYRCVIHLVVVMIRGCRGCGVAGVVQASALHTQLVGDLLGETEKRRRPCTEAVGLLERCQRELLQIRGTNVLHVFLGLIRHILCKDYNPPKGGVSARFKECLPHTHPSPQQVFSVTFFSRHFLCAEGQNTQCQRMTTMKKTLHGIFSTNIFSIITKIDCTAIINHITVSVRR